MLMLIKKSTNEVIIRDITITKENAGKVWRRESYVNFRKVRENMAGRVPWCRDPYSTLGRFHINQ